jgi:hypothetical protein
VPLPLDHGYEGGLDFLQYPGMNFDLPTSTQTRTTHDINGYPTPISRIDGFPVDTGVDPEKNMGLQGGLPPPDTLLELIELFFEHFYVYFPCFHRATFIQQVQSLRVQSETPSILYSMCALASRYHKDPYLKAQQRNWYDLAKFEYELTPRDPIYGLRTIQAAILVCFYGCTVGDFSAGWLCLGKAWRQACALGLNRIDADQDRYYGMDRPLPRSAIEREEFRRTLWLLFMMDRNHSWPTGWPNAITERQFKVDFPVPDQIFDAMTPDTKFEEIKATPFTRNLKSLISACSASAKPLNVFHYLCIAHVLLGQVSEQIHSLHDAPHTTEYAEECKALDESLIKFRISLPRATSSILECPPEAQAHVVWLQILLNTQFILLHYRAAGLIDTKDAHKQFMRAVAAAKNTAEIVKDATRVSTDLLLSAHVGSSLYIAACVLVIHWRMTDDKTLESDIELFKFVFERFYEAFHFLGLKFKLGLEHDLNRDRQSILDLRERGFRGLLADCSKWSYVQKKAEELGFTMT